MSFYGQYVNVWRTKKAADGGAAEKENRGETMSKMAKKEEK